MVLITKHEQYHLVCVCVSVLAITKNSMPKVNDTDSTKHLGTLLALVY